MKVCGQLRVPVPLSPIEKAPVPTEQTVGWPQQPVWDLRRKEKAELKVSIFIASLKCLVVILKSGL